MRVVPLVTCFILAALPSAATTIHVPGDQPTIAAGIAAASTGDTVLVACGSYAEQDVVLNKEIVLRSATGLPDCVAWQGVTPDRAVLTVRSVGDAARIEGITFHGTSRPKLLVESASPRVTDCAVLGGAATGVGVVINSASPVMTRCEIRGNDGSGVRTDEGSPVFVDCRFESNSAAGAGGAINSIDTTVGSITVLGCVFRNNAAAYGAAVYKVNGSFAATGTVFEGNSASIHGGALSLDCMLLLDSCEFRGNQAGLGGGIHAVGPSTKSVERCLFVDNSAIGYGGACVLDSPVSISECRFIENRAGTTGGVAVVAGYYAAVLSDCALLRNVAGQGASAIEAFDWVDLDVRSTLIAHGMGASSVAAGPRAAISFDCCDVYNPDARDDQFFAQIGANANFSADPVLCDEDGTSTALAELSWCRPENNACGQLVGAPDPASCDVPGVYVATEPPGLLVTGDGAVRRAAAYFRWEVGSEHSIGVTTPQPGPEGVLYQFASWDDGGAQSHTVTVSGDFQVHTASFDSLFWFSNEASGSGTVTPASHWAAPGTVLQIAAVPGPGWFFDHWEGEGEGSYTGTDSVATISVLEPTSQTAVFVSGPEKPVAVHSVPSGLRIEVDNVWDTTPQDFVWDVGSLHGFTVDRFQAVPGFDGRQRFTSWSNGQIARSFIYSAGNGTPDTVVAYFTTEYQLALLANEGGTVLPGEGWHAPGTNVVIEAVPDFSWVFETWIGLGDGSYTGPDNPVTVVMNETIRQRAIFREIGTGYDFAISASDTDPDVHTAPPAGDLRNLYFWMTCNERGLSAFEGAVTGSLDPLAFNPLNGVLNIGTASELLLAVPGCPTGPDVNFLLGYWIVHDDGGRICLGPSEANGILGAVDCDLPIPSLWPLRVNGFSSDGKPPCFVGTNGCFEGPVPVGLTQLRAFAEDRAVRLTWFSSSQRDYDGFWIYRGDSPEVLAKLTSEPWRGAAPYEYVDETVEPNRTYYYRVGAIAELGREELSEVVEITTPDWALLVTGLSRIRPNPFVQTAEIEFTVARAGPVRVSIYDVSGRLIRTLLDAELPAGDHATSWDGKNAAGEKVTGGVYLTRLDAAGATQAKKTVFLGSR